MLIYISLVLFSIDIDIMGCRESKQGGNSAANGPEAALPSLDLSGLDGPTKFEYMLPFRHTKIEVFEQKIKNVSNDSKSITLE